MIYDTTFKDLLSESMAYGQQVNLEECLVVAYSGQMPDKDAFVSDWQALYYVVRGDNNNGLHQAYNGTNVIATYGWASQGSDSNRFIKIKNVNNEFYFDSSTMSWGALTKHKVRDGEISFVAIFPHSTANISSSSDGGSAIDMAFMLVSASDIQGSGIAKFEWTDTTIGTPTLLSLEFEVNMGGA
jgi:hypothetical protein